ncbi:hypothetical protein PLESTB_000567200 [Pleodorina starrii]|uniref:Uncharacterized protein n=1 Tax=Pleodorina starrii TaxID=330485 RepID=A0A9W6F0R8_9CHLO|nr:hypothetical protein PLESTB_000567200 [Pleodorina starrii]
MTPYAAPSFYHIHVTSVVRRGLLEYLHISKSGGTSFSAAAKHSGCLMAPGIGQLEALGDLPRWINGTAFEELTGGTSIMWSYYGSKGRPAQGQSCTGRLAHLKELGYNYVSNEFTLHGGGGSGGGGGGSRGAEGLHATHVCPGSVNVVTLRQPDGRLASHLHYMLARVKKRLLGKTDFDTSDFFDTFCTGDVAMWQRVAPPVVDNYALRSFIGERAFHSPVGGIGSEHVKVARRLLLQFDLVMDLDAGEEAADLAMRQGLGWNVSLSELHVRTSSQTFAKLHYSKEDCPNEELLRLLLPRQEPDRQLYSTGRTLAFLDGVFLDVAQALGLRPNSLAAGTVPPPARGTGTVKGSPACGLLNAGATGRRKTAGRKARLMVR